MAVQNPSKAEIAKAIEQLEALGLEVQAPKRNSYRVKYKNQSSIADFSPAQLIAFCCGFSMGRFWAGDQLRKLVD